MTDDTVGSPSERLQIGQAVEVRRGSLEGMKGLLIGFSPNGNCKIEVDTLSGVTLVINTAAVAARTRLVQTMSLPTPAAAV
jgi:hypothetical protein